MTQFRENGAEQTRPELSFSWKASLIMAECKKGKRGNPPGRPVCNEPENFGGNATFDHFVTFGVLKDLTFFYNKEFLLEKLIKTDTCSNLKLIIFGMLVLV